MIETSDKTKSISFLCFNFHFLNRLLRWLRRLQRRPHHLWLLDSIYRFIMMLLKCLNLFQARSNEQTAKIVYNHWLSFINNSLLVLSEKLWQKCLEMEKNLQVDRFNEVRSNARKNCFTLITLDFYAFYDRTVLLCKHKITFTFSSKQRRRFLYQMNVIIVWRTILGPNLAKDLYPQCNENANWAANHKKFRWKCHWHVNHKQSTKREHGTSKLSINMCMQF